MKYSKRWLQNYIVETLPEDESIEKELNAKAFEVEEISDFRGDSIFDIKVLPNRAHDALGHYGMAREICACLDLTLKPKTEIFASDLDIDQSVENVSVEVLDARACPKFMAVRIDGVRVEESPVWLREAIEFIGQRSINNIVDITNYVQYTLNKPMHAYDAKNIVDGIVVRYAEEGEKLLTLDDKDLTLNAKTLVIADKEKALGLAGIKGGKYSGINSDTASIVIESANFEPVLIRKTSQKYSVHTDASKRFENGIANTLVSEGLYMAVSEMLKLFPSAKVGLVTDTNDIVEPNYHIGLTLSNINQILGKDFNKEEIENALKKLNFKNEKIVVKDYIIANYENLVGKEYKNPSSMRVDAPEYFSCSSLVSYLFKGVWMPSLSIDKYVFSQKIKEEELTPLDLIFANSGEGLIRYESIEFMRGTKVPAGIDHVAIYLGDDKVLHSTKRSGKVTIESLSDFKINRTISGFGRVANDLSEERFLIEVPSERLDLRIKEDMVEEIGRIIGYDKLTPTLPVIDRDGLINQKLYYKNIIRNILFTHGYSEVINYTFTKEGEVALAKAASDKNKLRTNLTDGLVEAINKNVHNMSLLDIDSVKVFEFGNCFVDGYEWTSLAIGVDDGKKKSNFSEEIDLILSEIKRTLRLTKLDYEKKSVKPLVVELSFDEIVTVLDENINNVYLDKNLVREVRYKSFSMMPFIVRDVAFWALESLSSDDIEKAIKDNAGDLCVSVKKFDEFKKDDKVSLGYRLVYQDMSRTLTDEEVNVYAENVYGKLKELGCEIR
jgi:phenylalanyl-tRNA synthetase beta subunit